MVWPISLVLGGYLAWQTWGAQHVLNKYYSIDPAMIHITARPAYITSDVAAAVYADTGLDKLSLLDPAAAARIASAFSFHPWIRKVVAVRKLPGGGVDVHVQYRRPVAMVFVISRHPGISGRSFFAIDEDAVLLPTDEFSKDATMQYLQIEIPDVYPTGGKGSTFGDGRIASAAKVASTVDRIRDLLKLRSIRLDDSSRTSPVPQFNLIAADGREWFWGSAPGEELYAEPNAEEKIRQLIRVVQDPAETEQANRTPTPAPR